MAGGHANFRHLSRKSSHRQALLRNLVDSLIEHESIQTTWHKAKEAQRLAEKLITLGKKNTEASRRKAMSIFYRPTILLPKLFGPLAERYASRPGGYTRVLRIEPLKEDQAPSAILELIDGPKDIRWAMTARTMASERAQRTNDASGGRGASDNRNGGASGQSNSELREITQKNIEKVTRFRENGKEDLEALAVWFERDVRPAEESGETEITLREKRKVYPAARHLKETPKKARWTRN